jgi:hypothetical protein
MMDNDPMFVRVGEVHDSSRRARAVSLDPVLNTLNLNLFILEMIPSYLDTV